MINKITKEEYPNLWDIIVDDYYSTTEKKHRRNSNFYTNLIYKIDEEICPDNPELHGFWMSETIIWDSEYGMDDDIDVLYRAEQQEKTVVIKEWVMIK